MKNKFKIFDIIWTVFINISIIVVSLITKSNTIQIILSICGINYVFLVGKEIRFAHILGLIYTSLYCIVLWQEGLYGNALYNIFYAIPMIIYAYVIWGRKKGKNSSNEEVVIIKLSNVKRLLLFLLIMIAITIYIFIAKKTGVNFVLVDAINIIFGLVGMYLIAKKYIEQWFCWIIINSTNIVFWSIQSVYNNSNLTLVCLYIIFLFTSIYGFIDWLKLLKLNEFDNIKKDIEGV